MGNSYLPEKAAKGQVKKETLYDLYVNKGLSIVECGRSFGLSFYKMRKKFDTLGVQVKASNFKKGKAGPNKGKCGRNAANWKGGKVSCHCVDCGKKIGLFYPSVKRSRCKDCNNSRYDLTGKRFGNLLVLRKTGLNKHAKALWLCECDCANNVEVVAGALKSGATKSCGCLRNKKGKESPSYKPKVVVACAYCGKEKKIFPCHHKAYQKHFCSDTDCYGKWMSENLIGEKNHRWKGGKDVAWFETYGPALKRFERTRRAPDNTDLLEVKCAYCGKWFKPSRLQVTMRVEVINGKGGEHRIYCSEECKSQCPTYKRVWHVKGFKKASSREVNPLLRQMCFKRDDWTCQMCGSESKLHCHHVKSYTQNKILGNDIDNTITLCKRCHKKVHSEQGCKYYELKCVNN